MKTKTESICCKTLSVFSLRFLVPLLIYTGCSRKHCLVDPRGIALVFCKAINRRGARMPCKKLRSPLKTTHRVVFFTLRSIPLSLLLQKNAAPRGGCIFLVDPRGIEPLSENSSDRLSSWAVCYESLPRGAQTDTRHLSAALFWMTGSRTNHRCTFPAVVTHTSEPQDSHRVRVALSHGTAVRQPERLSYRLRLILGRTVLRGCPARHAYLASKSPSKPLRAHEAFQSSSYLRDFLARSMSRAASRAAAVSRLSYSFFPRHSPSSTLTFPRVK